MLCTLVLVVAQGAVAHRFGVGVLRLDLFLPAAVYLSLEARARPALFCALGLGLLRDACSLGRPGAAALVMRFERDSGQSWGWGLSAPAL